MDFVQSTLFENMDRAPLAERLRPRTLDEYIGQIHILGKGKVLRQLIESDNITSMILWGPPRTVVNSGHCKNCQSPKASRSLQAGLLVSKKRANQNFALTLNCWRKPAGIDREGIQS